MGSEHISFTTSKIGSLVDVQISKDPEGLRIFYYLVQDLEARGEEDRISELVGDLIFEFLRRFDMNSAAQTSLLSKRWRYVWTNWTDLDFDPWKTIPEYDRYEAPDSESMRARYSEWVSQVVNGHHGPSVDRFRIFFPFDATCSNQIDAWIKFAISKKVKKLELDFFKLLDPMDRDYRLCMNVVSRDLGGLSFLTSLHLSKVSVSEEFLEEFILVQCPFLEELYVFFSVDLVGFKLKDSSCKCKLKRLGIRGCPNLEMVKIHSDSLKYFEFWDAFRWDAQFTVVQTLIELDCVPSLVEASFGGQCCYTPDLILKTIALVSKNQVSVLTMNLKTSDLLGYNAHRHNIPSLNNIKRLTLMVSDSEWVDDVLPFFIKACPVLCELQIQVYWGACMFEEAQKASELLEIEEKSLKDYQGMLIEDKDTYPSLRVFEVVGFLGTHLDVLLMWFIAIRAFNLETIMCDPHYYSNEYYADEDDELVSMKETFRQRASKFARSLASLQSGLNVIIK